MKFIYKSLIAIVLVFSLSCEQSLDEINVDPDTFPTAGDAQLLTGAIGMMGYMQEVELNMYSFLWAQYYTWGLGVSLGNQERYVAEAGDFDNYWEWAYSDALIDLQVLTNSESRAYQGIGKTLKAYIFQGLVDHFGDIPYSEALRGEPAVGGIQTPGYDTAPGVYDSLVMLIDQAIVDLNFAIDQQSTDVGDDDLIFGGRLVGGDPEPANRKLTRWLRFANSLKLRILLRTSEVDPQTAAVQSLVNTGIFIETVEDMPMIPFTNVAGNQNPMFARMEWGVGDFYFASNATLNLLNDLNDPRDTVFYAEATAGPSIGQLRGIDQGSVDEEPFTADAAEYSGSTPYAYAAGNDVILMSPWEVWFLRAEADARYATADDDVAALTSGIASSFSYTGVSGAAAYTTSLGYDAGDPLDTKLDIIATQKYISLNGTQEDEGWIETRRFDRPASRLFSTSIFQTPIESALGANVHPATWLYPSSERNLNPKAPQQRAITDKIFWDN